MIPDIYFKKSPESAKDNSVTIGNMCNTFVTGLITTLFFLAITNNETTERDFAHIKKPIPFNRRTKIQHENGTITENEIKLKALTTKWEIKTFTQMTCRIFYKTFKYKMELLDITRQCWSQENLTEQE